MHSNSTFKTRKHGFTISMHSNSTFKTRKHGFTLIEIMVVIVIMGVLAMVATPKLIAYSERVKEKADMMKLYYLRDALNRALLESEVALYQSDFVTKGDKAADNLQILKQSCRQSPNTKKQAGKRSWRRFVRYRNASE